MSEPILHECEDALIKGVYMMYDKEDESWFLYQDQSTNYTDDLTLAGDLKYCPWCGDKLE